MTNPTDAQIAEIARGLTLTERTELRFGRPDRSRDWHGRTWMVAGRTLKAKGLIGFVPDLRSSATVLTPLGLLVRAHLTQRSEA